jgi:conjugative transposon TraJ protein
MDVNTIVAEMGAMETMLEGLYDDMVPLVSSFTNVGRAVGALGALVFIAVRVWGHQARAESIDFFPLLRPFAIGFVIVLFPQFCQMLRSITVGLSHSTEIIRANQSAEITKLQAEKVDLLSKKPENKYFVTDEAYEKRLKELAGYTGMGGIGDRMSLSFDKMAYDVNQSFREWMKNVLELFHVAARLLINVLATFLLIVLSVLGPLAFGIAIIPGFGGGITKWLGHFLTVSLWVPVCNIFGCIMATFQVHMLQSDVDRINSGAGVDSADFGYLVFLCIAIAGYLLVPMVTDMLVAASGAGGMAQAFMGATAAVAGTAGAAAGMGGRGAMGAAGAVGDAAQAANSFGSGMGGGALSAEPTRGELLSHRAGTAVGNQIRKLRGGSSS